jgi:hypothetical protein
MKAAIFATFALAFSLPAQITTSLHHLPGGWDEVKIRNDSKASLTAFVVTARRVPLSANNSSAPYVEFSDPLVESTQTPLAPNQERVVIRHGFRDPSGKSRRLVEEPITAAGIFADGTTTGDPVLLTRLILRRSSMLMAVETALEALSDAGRRNIPREQLIRQFQKMADSLNRWYLSPEQQVGRDVYQSIVGKLTNMPEPELGSPFPPAAFVAQETARLNQQRVTLAESQPNLADAAFVKMGALP